MGKFFYGPWGAELQIDDRTLHHLRAVIVAKLRRGESFTFAWDSTRDEGSGQDLFWLSPALPLHFRFNGNRRPTLNRAWVDALMLTANESSGLHAVDEPHENPTKP